jgi:hypothetical protein
MCQVEAALPTYVRVIAGDYKRLSLSEGLPRSSAQAHYRA